MASLKDYERKRTRGKTPEPFAAGRRGKEPIFVVQRHDARRLHYDFRLERDGALASWAVPKGVPLEPGTQHLAVHVEDHPLSYADFEGEIPAGNYGAGTVEIWDSGTYELVEEKPNGGLTVRLHGERLEGLWTLVPAKLSGDPKNWLLVRRSDERRARRRSARRALRADARDARRGGADGRGLAARGEVGRLPGARDDRAAARSTCAAATTSRSDRPLPHRRPRARALAADAGLRPRRRGRARVGERRPRDLLGDAAGQGGHDVPLRRLRRAGGRRRAARRPAARRSGASRLARRWSTCAAGGVQLSDVSTTAPRSTRPRRSSSSRGSWPSGPTPATCRAGVAATG